MSIGSSGRIVIDIDPETKRQLHSALSRHGLTMKQWFLAQTTAFLQVDTQPSLPMFGLDETAAQTPPANHNS